MKLNKIEERCNNCGKLRADHIDYFNTGKKNVCPYRKSMKFDNKKEGSVIENETERI